MPVSNNRSYRLLIPVLALIAVLLAAAFGGLKLHLVTTEFVPLILMLFFISVCEEFGWRGFLQDKLQSSLSVLAASAIVGLVWAVWHYPPSLVGIGTPQDFPFWRFVLWVVPAAIIIGWVYSRTGNVLLTTFCTLPLTPPSTTFRSYRKIPE
ncbi:MAG: CPBP family intramembrane glutamic endopeptidase [Paracoccaceae bacterium]